ncbi:hypothetical protein [Candidatus Enterococcus willemsii]|uniref:hypothetical protein n=1 Tax=Candidatus Enterococcus willemsii TaxID=1857215 RepID=UPI001F37DCB9|nr:hypothetical protein [Enterococcus sp. CU12B]
MLSEEQQDELTKMLLIPINADKLTTSIKKKGSTMISPQIYKGVEDLDMSDLLVDFYETIYKDILFQNKTGKNKVLGKLDKKMDFNINVFVNSSFTGDTMNSFRTIAGKVIKVLTYGWQTNQKSLLYAR